MPGPWKKRGSAFPMAPRVSTVKAHGVETLVRGGGAHVRRDFQAADEVGVVGAAGAGERPVAALRERDAEAGGEARNAGQAPALGDALGSEREAANDGRLV